MNNNPGAYEQNNDHKRPNDGAQDKMKTYLTLKESYKCGFCDKNHLTSRCTEVIHMTLRDRQAKIKRNNLCENCFYPHPVSECPFKPACKKCEAPHRTLLHPDSKQMFLNVTEQDGATAASNLDDSHHDDDDRLSLISQMHFFNVNGESDGEVLLTTAIIPVLSNNRSVALHALVDD